MSENSTFNQPLSLSAISSARPKILALCRSLNLFDGVDPAFQSGKTIEEGATRSSAVLCTAYLQQGTSRRMSVMRQLFLLLLFGAFSVEW